MAATATEQPALDRLTVLTSGGEHGVTWARGTRTADAAQRGEDLRKFRPAGGKEAIRAALALKEGENRYNVRHTADFLKRFGTGKEDQTRMSPSERASYMAAEQILHQNAKIALFLELRTLPPAEQVAMLGDKDVKVAIGEKAASTVTYAEVRKAALDSIVRDPSFISMFPEVNAHQPPLTPGQKMDFIEKTLLPADDQRFAARLGSRMQDAYRDSLKFTNVVSDEQREKFRTEQNEARLTLEQKAKQIADILDSKGILKAGSGRFTEADVAKWITQSSAAPENTIADILEKASGQTHQDFTEMVQFKAAETQMPTLEASFRAKHAAGPHAAAAFDLNGYLTGNPADADVIKFKTLQAAFTTGVAKFGTAAQTGGAVGPNRAAYETFDSTFSPLLAEPGLKTAATDAKNAQTKADTLDIKLKGLPVITVAEEQAELTRLLQEEDLCGKLDNVLGQTIADVLEERYDVMEERMGRLTTEKQKTAEQTTQKLVLELKKKMNSNWIGYDASTHKRTVNKPRIKEDVTHLGFTYDKDVALKQLIARDLFKVTRYDTLNMVDGKNSTAGGGTLSADQIAQVNKVFDLAGGEYRDKLFADLLAARSFTDRNFNFGFGLEKTTGQLGFKRHEWQQMIKLYEPEITKGLEGNRDAAAALRSLEAQGVKIDTNMKWVWYLLALLTGGIGGGLAGPGLVNIATGTASAVGSHIAAGSVAQAVGEVGGAVAGGFGAKKIVDSI